MLTSSCNVGLGIQDSETLDVFEWDMVISHLRILLQTLANTRVYMAQNTKHKQGKLYSNDNLFAMRETRRGCFLDHSVPLS
jgi:hypothetical protein